MTDGQPESGPGPPDHPGITVLARARARSTQAFRSLLRPEGLPSEAAAQLESAFGSVGRAAISGGRGRLRRVRAQVRAAPPRLLDWMSGQVLDHPAVLYDQAGVELLASRQGRSISTAMGAVQLALVAAAAATTLEGGPVLALAIDGAVGQVASVVHGFCDWYNTGSYLVRRLNECGHRGRPDRGAAPDQCRIDVEGQDGRRAGARPGRPSCASSGAGWAGGWSMPCPSGRRSAGRRCGPRPGSTSRTWPVWSGRSGGSRADHGVRSPAASGSAPAHVVRPRAGRAVPVG